MYVHEQLELKLNLEEAVFHRIWHPTIVAALDFLSALHFIIVLFWPQSVLNFGGLIPDPDSQMSCDAL